MSFKGIFPLNYDPPLPHCSAGRGIPYWQLISVFDCNKSFGRTSANDEKLLGAEVAIKAEESPWPETLHGDPEHRLLIGYPCGKTISK